MLTFIDESKMSHVSDRVPCPARLAGADWASCVVSLLSLALKAEGEALITLLPPPIERTGTGILTVSVSMAERRSFGPHAAFGRDQRMFFLCLQRRTRYPKQTASFVFNVFQECCNCRSTHTRCLLWFVASP